MLHKQKSAGLLVAAALALGGCEALGLGEDPTVSVSFAAPGNGTRASFLVADSFSDGLHAINLTNVDVVLDEVTLEHAEHEVGGDSDGESDADSDSDGSSNERLRRGPFTVSLPLNGGVVTPINEALPTGAYEKVELDVEYIRFRGTYDGQPFDVTLPLNTELELEFEQDFIVDDDADRLNLTIEFDIASWLRNSSGVLIDPRLLAGNGSVRAAVVNRIRSSIKAYEDSDRDADDEDSDSDSR
jgi:hypothetical protein